MAQQTQHLGLKVFDFAVDSTPSFVHGVAGLQESNMHIIDEELGNARTDFQNKKHASLSDRLTEDLGLVYNEINQLSLVGFDGEGTLKTTANGITRDMTVKGNTLHNLLGDGFLNMSNYSISGSNFIQQQESYVVFNFTELTSSYNIGTRRKIETIPLKPTTQYTIVTEVIENTLNTSSFEVNHANGMNVFSSKGNVAIPKNFIGMHTFLATTPETFSGKNCVTWVTHNLPLETGKIKFRQMILEGDYTNKPLPPYFEGVRSVGDVNNTIEVKSTGKNLVNFDKLGTSAWIGNLVNVDLNKSYNYSAMIDNTNLTNTYSRSRLEFHHYDGDITYVGATCNAGKKIRVNQTFSITKPFKDIYFRKLQYFSNEPQGVSIITDIQLEEATTTTPYMPYIEDKKKITLDEPLRSLPNGVRDEIVGNKLIRRIGKATTDDLTVAHSSGSAYYNTTSCAVLLNLKGHKPAFKRTNGGSNGLICDRYYTTLSKNVWSNNYNETAISSVSGLWDFCIREKNSNTGITSDNASQHIEKFTQYLKTNSITVYYELATPVETILSKDMNVKTFPEVTHITNTNNPIKADLTYKAPVDLPAMMHDLVARNHELEVQTQFLTAQLDVFNDKIEVINNLALKLGLAE